MHSPIGRMHKNAIKKKPFIKSKNDSNKHFDTIQIMVYGKRVSHTQRFNSRNKQNYIWKGSAAQPIARKTLFLPRDRGGSRNIGAADRRPSIQNKIPTSTRKERQHQHLDLSWKILGIFQDTQLYTPLAIPT